MPSMKRLVLVDGNALLHRAYHATPPLTTVQGELVNAVYGFTLLLLKAIDDLMPDYIAVAWDMKAPTFRHTAYEGYKAHRGPTDDALHGQYDRVFEVLRAFNIPEFKLPGFEADDLVGALAKQAVAKDKVLEVIIVTGDRDIMQLIDKRIKVLMPRKTISDVGLYGIPEFRERWGFEPINLIDYKGLAGDASDNIPGVPGIGDVSATKLVKEYQTVEKIYKNLDKLPDRMRKLLEEGHDSALMSKKLATIETEIPINLDLQACRVHDFDRETVVKLFEELQFKSLIARIPGNSMVSNVPPSEIFPDKEEKSDSPSVDVFSGGGITTDLDHEVEPILQKMSAVGVLIDCPFLDKLGTDLKSQLAEIEKKIYEHVGHEFNLNSPKQLGEILFDELNLPVIRKTKTGRSTDEETLRELSAAHPAIPLLLKYRQLYKLISTYVDALPRFVGEDGRIHSTFNVEGAATGRLSSVNPNLQNIPVRGELGGEIRRAFIAPEGKVLLAADYSQIELRIMAHLANDSGLKKAFQEGFDIHALTASRIFKIPVEQVNKEQRAVGKTMNFATLYGQGPRALAKQLAVDTAIAKSYILEYFQQFPNVKDWMQRTLEFGYQNGYVETIWGRRRYIPELQMHNQMMKAFGERAAINHPVQGTSADMIKKAMVEVNKWLESRDKSQGNKCKLILQVHDELLFECDEECVDETAQMVKDKMEHALLLDVPVLAEVKVGNNWAEMSPLNI
jgi:5'-3' exonuclease